MRRAALAALVLAGPAWAGDALTLLVPRPSGSLEFLDPGSGLRLATLALETTPRRVAVSPDGLRAAVLGCTSLEPSRPGPVRISLVDVRQPRELQRIDLGVQACPRSLAWRRAERIVTLDGRDGTARELELDSSTWLADPPGPAAAPEEGDAGPSPWTLRDSIAVQQYVAGGGRVDDLALAPAAPRATCHACTPDP